MTLANLPALPSNIKGPASFLGVIGPSDPGTPSALEGDRPLGLGVRTVPRLARGSGLSRREELPTTIVLPFLLAISTGATVEFETS